MFGFITAILTSVSFIILSAGTAQSFPPPLSAKGEREYFKKMKEDGDITAREKLIEHNLRLVSHIVRKYYGSHGSSDELLSIGSIGLIKAIDTFEYTNGARLATYAAKCIQNEILMYFRSQKKQSLEVSIDETIDIDREGNPLTYIDIIKCDDTIADDLDRKFRAKKAMDYIRSMLDERERRIIILRYGLDGSDPITQRETAEALGISRSYVSRIEKSVLSDLKDYLQ
ncbi:MAG: sigma-70 family RNA polymerase sigma factor [Ruminococcaceae bacterium]|nr:sigma-70 family RNA polymerase sigma factor [Oscillospiraceae bacterium]